MKRIRKVDYYHRVAEPPPVAQDAVESFLRKTLKQNLRAAPNHVPAHLAGRCMAAPGVGMLFVAVADVEAVLGAPIDHAGLSSVEANELIQLAWTALDALRPPVGRRHRVFGDPQFWTLGNALMPFTDTSTPFMVKVRRCRICGCRVRVEDQMCPFCFLPAPTGKAKRAWVREQIHLVQPLAGAAGQGAPAHRWINPAATGDEDESYDSIDEDSEEEESGFDVNPDNDGDTEDEDVDEDPEEE